MQRMLEIGTCTCIKTEGNAMYERQIGTCTCIKTEGNAMYERQIGREVDQLPGVFVAQP